MELKSIIGDYELFLDTILQRVGDTNFNLHDFVQIGHLCYRTVSTDNYLEKQKELKSIATLLSEVLVNERLISTFRLKQPILHKGWRIDAVELPAPKPGGQYKEGLEHIEFVLYDSFDMFLDRYKDKPFELQAADRGINPEIGLKLGEYSVKFHLLSLTTAVFLQEKLGMRDIRNNMN